MFVHYKRKIYSICQEKINTLRTVGDSVTLGDPLSQPTQETDQQWRQLSHVLEQHFFFFFLTLPVLCFTFQEDLYFYECWEKRIG